jgi:hypothetical protein
VGRAGRADTQRESLLRQPTIVRLEVDRRLLQRLVGLSEKIGTQKALKGFAREVELDFDF